MKLLQFVRIKQQRPKITKADVRQKTHDEIYAAFDPKTAQEQASRCSQCGVPFCQIHCPLQNNIPDWLMLAAQGRMQEAYEISSATNNFPEICGRICPQDKLCEGNCVIENGFESVTIGQIEKHITETAFEQGWVKPISVARENGFSVGIIGSGPAGMAAAEELRKKGYAAHIYDRYDRVGGLMIYGIPNFKLDKSVVQRREDLLRQSGIQFHLNHTVGETITLEQLRNRHDAVLVATGVYKAHALGIPNAGFDNSVSALDYLTASNRTQLGDNVEAFTKGVLNAKGKKVIVVGGGDTAMDCVRTAIRQGAKSVTCLYRRNRANMPGSAREVKNAEEEGVVFEWLSAPKALDKNGKRGRVMVERMKLGTADTSGRLEPMPLGTPLEAFDADMAIEALGFAPEDLPALFNAPELSVTSRGTLKIDKHMMTGLHGVFAAGDIVRGASLVVWAIKDGREAADAIDHYITANTIAKQASIS